MQKYTSISCNENMKMYKIENDLFEFEKIETEATVMNNVYIRGPRAYFALAWRRQQVCPSMELLTLFLSAKFILKRLCDVPACDPLLLFFL